MALRLNGSGSGYVGIDAPVNAGNNTLVLPNGNGSNGQALTTNGSGTLSWTSITSSQWTTSGSDINYTAGRVLVGTSTASATSTAIFQGHSSSSTAESIFILSRSSVSASGDTIGQIRFTTSNGANDFAKIEAVVDGTPGTNDNPCRLVFSTTADGSPSTTERMRITNLGALKASTTGNYSLASYAVHELRSNQNNRTVWVSNTNASPYGLYVKYEGYDPNGTDNEFLVCDGNGTVRASIRSNGGLANFQSNNVNLSDRNAKKDISPAADAWDCIKEWEIVNYRYKDQPDDADLNLGVIAQQVAESCPEVITVFSEAKEATDDQPAQEERLGVKEQQMYWMAIKALQEAMERIETLEAANASLEARLTALEVTP